MATKRTKQPVVPEDVKPTSGQSSPSQSQEPNAGSDLSSNKFMRYLNAVTKGTDDEVRQSLNDMSNELIAAFPVSQQYHIVYLLEPANKIDDHDLNKVFTALKKMDKNSPKDILLLLLSRGGSIEPAYQISKLCKAFCKDRFVVAVPRYAKSAATLIALGADEIHMGQLGQLGPIDPQLGNLPALGVGQAIQSISRLAEEYPGSAQMLALYLKEVLTIEQIGYCDRIAESAVQYAQRLLSTKDHISAEHALTIATKLVHEYKDHGFVIDSGEASALLGGEWIFTDSDEMNLAESLYTLFDQTNQFLRMRSKRLLVLGDFEDGQIILSTT